jgi:hypothetical protein
LIHIIQFIDARSWFDRVECFSRFTVMPGIPCFPSMPGGPGGPLIDE